jgi:UDP-N-acetylmuramyl pentapeptide phosphotransferase/UDP-N-acetylglucosamine-1-phosphate transferase
VWIIVPFPKVKDFHKPGTPLVPNCFGIFYVLVSVCYWFILAFVGLMETEAIALTSSVLFGATMGLFDDVADLRWRYKAILPVFAALPYIVLKPSDRTAISLLLIGVLRLGELFFIVLVPLIVTITTNVYNQLGGLNGLESLTGLIVLIGLTLASDNGGKLLLSIVPILCLIVLGYISYRGKAFIGNIGSFSIGLTLAVYATLMNVKSTLLISLIPFIFNSLLILYSNYILQDKADTEIDEEGFLYAKRIRSLRTMILYYKRLSEHQTVIIICLIIAFFTILGVSVQRLIL